MWKRVVLAIFLFALNDGALGQPPLPLFDLTPLPRPKMLVQLFRFSIKDIDNKENEVKETPQSGVGVIAPKCPKTLGSITDSPNGNQYLFNGEYVWAIKNRTIFDGPTKISEVFPNGPRVVNASVSSRELTVLLEERTFYGYTQDEVTGEFKQADGFPAKLNDLVLFFPVAAFPLSNASVILLSHFNAGATYNLFNNQPSLLINKDEFFPGLPINLVSGIPDTRGSDDFYTMFTKNNVYKYDNRLGEIVHAQPLSSYLVCK